MRLKDDYAGYMAARSQHLHAFAKKLAGVEQQEFREEPPEEIDDSEVDPTQ